MSTKKPTTSKPSAPPDPKWHKTRKWERGFCCTYGVDADVVPGAPTMRLYGCRKPVIIVDGHRAGVGRCAKHDPRIAHVKRRKKTP